jgi:hypothetical protein
LRVHRYKLPLPVKLLRVPFTAVIISAVTPVTPLENLIYTELFPPTIMLGTSTVTVAVIDVSICSLGANVGAGVGVVVGAGVGAGVGVVVGAGVGASVGVLPAADLIVPCTYTAVNAPAPVMENGDVGGAALAIPAPVLIVPDTYMVVSAPAPVTLNC